MARRAARREKLGKQCERQSAKVWEGWVSGEDHDDSSGKFYGELNFPEIFFNTDLVKKE